MMFRIKIRAYSKDYGNKNLRASFFMKERFMWEKELFLGGGDLVSFPGKQNS